MPGWLPLQMSHLEGVSGAAVRLSEQLQRQRANVLAALDTLKVGMV